MQKEQTFFEIVTRRRRSRVWQKFVSVMACIVVFCTTYALILPAITKEAAAYCGYEEHTHSEECFDSAEQEKLICDIEEHEAHTHTELCWLPAHAHTDDCYARALVCALEELEGHGHGADCYIESEAVLSCGQEESEVHTHSDQCYTGGQLQLVCTREETAGHSHDDSCYGAESICVCGLEERAEALLNCEEEESLGHAHGEECYETVIPADVLLCQQEEHTHELICFSNKEADLENADIWEKTLPNLTGVWRDDFVEVASSQLGVTESAANYLVQNETETKGYSRYGAWAGDPYGDWNLYFIQFCLHYAEIPEEKFPGNQDLQKWIADLKKLDMYTEDEGYTASVGDIIFLNLDDNDDDDADMAGIVISTNDRGYVTALLGDHNNAVSKETYPPEANEIVGYGIMPNNEDASAGETEPAGKNDSEPAEITEPINDSQTEETTEATEETGEVDDNPLHASIDVGILVSQVEDRVENQVVSRWNLATFGLMRVGEGDNSGSINAQASYPDMKDFIDSLNVFYRENSSDPWTELTSNITVGKGTELRYELSYTIDTGTLSAENNVVIYKLPLDEVSLEKTGDVMDGGTKVGTYIIDENGIMTITYNKDFAEKNKVKDITGTINFAALVDSFKLDDNGEIHIDTTDGNSFTIHIQDESTKYNDLTVDKAAEIVDKDNGIIKYTITVSSESGTSGGLVYLKDWMNNNTYYEGNGYAGISVVDGNNQPVSVTAPAVGTNDFTLQLPEMNAGDHYTITYFAKATTASQWNTRPSNSVHVDATSGDEKFHGEDYVDTNFDFSDSPVGKSHTADANGNITWTITLDADKANKLNGWKLEDTMSGQAGNVTLQYVENGQPHYETIQLPYTFNKDYSGTVTITYVTKAEYELGHGGVSNTAKLTPPQNVFKPEYSVTDQYTYPNGTYNPLDKQLKGMDQNYSYLEWSLTLSNNPKVVPGPWTIRDELSNNQYYTQEQADKIRSKISTLLSQIYGSNIPDYTLTFDGSYAAPDGSTGYTGFTLEVNADLPVIPVGTSYSFDYSSTPDLGDGTQELYFNNGAYLNNVYDSAGANYNPVLTKKGGNWSTGATITDISNGGAAELKWYVQLNVTEEMKQSNKDLIITEDVPDNLDLTYFVLNHNFTIDIETLERENEFSIKSYVDGVYYKVNKVSEGGDLRYVITIPYETYRDQGVKDVFMELRFALPEDFVPSQYPNDDVHFMHDIYTNRVYVSYKGEGPFAETEHTQTVIDPSITNGQDTETSEKIIKYIGTPDSQNELPYVIQINHKAEDLNPDSDWLKVEDILTFINSNMVNGKIQAALDPQSVKISLYDAEGNPYVDASGNTYIGSPLSPITGSEVDYATLAVPGGYAPSSKTTLSDDGKSETAEHTINFYVPDNCFIKLEYCYKFRGSGSATINNIAKVTAFSTEYVGSEDGRVEVKDADVTATVSVINIEKVDAANSSIKLPGAVYELYEYQIDQETKVGDYHYVAILESDENGNLKLASEQADDINYVIKQDTAYYLVEIHAPSGYVLDEHRHYFLVMDGNVGTKETAPDDFLVRDRYFNDATISIPNERSTRSISVNKKWRDADGHEIFPPAGTTIQVQLNKTLTYDSPDADISSGEDVTVQLAVGVNSYRDENYPLRDIESSLNGQAVKTGDIITITYQDMDVDPTSAADLLPGLMDIRDDANYHVPYEAVDKGNGKWDYVFQLKVRRDTLLRGWTYDESIQVTISRTPYDQVSASGSTTAETVILSSENGWTKTWSDLDKYELNENGQILGYYTYSFSEVQAPDGYVTDVTVDGGMTTITNSLPADTDLTVKKDWNVAAGTATPGSIGFTLYRVTHDEKPSEELVNVTFKIYNTIDNVEKVTWEQTISCPAGTTLQFDHFQQHWTYARLNGNDISGTQEYIPALELSKVTYTFTAETDSLFESWPDVVPTSGRMPTIDFARSSAGEAIGTHQLTADGNWTTTIQDLPLEAMVDVTENGITTKKHVYYSYYVAENLPGYTTSYDVYDNVYTICPDVTKSGTEITIVNTPVGDSETTGITVNKSWVGANGSDLTDKQLNFTVHRVYRTSPDGEWIEDTSYVDHFTLGGTSDSPWTWTSGELLKEQTVNGITTYYAYYVEEANGKMYEVTYTQDGTGTAVNANTPVTEGTINVVNKVTSLTVQKQWLALSEGSSHVQPNSISIKLYLSPDGGKTKYPYPDENTSYQIYAANNWSITITGLPVADENGNPYSYHVEEEPVTGYDPDPDVVKDSSGNWIIINEPVTEIKVVKKWTDNVSEGKPDVYVQLYQIYTPTVGTPVTKAYGAAVPLGESAPDGIDKTWRHLPLYEYDESRQIVGYYTYFVVEENGVIYDAVYNGQAPNDYTLEDGTEVSGSNAVASGTITITNKATKVEVEKVWKDGSGTALTENLPESISFKLMQSVDGGEPIVYGVYTVDAKDGWHLVIDDLPYQNAEGIQYTYYVEEVAVHGFDSDIAITSESEGYFSFTITNTVKEVESEKTELTVEKVWEDVNGDPYSPKDEKVTLNLMQIVTKSDDTTTTNTYDSIELPADVEGNPVWEHTFTNLPLSDPDGTSYSYYIEEQDGAQYEATYVVDGTENVVDADHPVTSGTVTVTNTVTSLEVSKIWHTYADQSEGGSHEAIEVNVYRTVNGLKEEQPFKTLTLSEDSKWKASLEGLPVKDANGNDITYTVEEVVDENFRYWVTVTEDKNEDGTYSYIITNRNRDPVIDKTQVTVEKIWKDVNGNVYTPTNESVVIKLMQTVTDMNQAGEPVTLLLMGEWNLTQPEGTYNNKEVVTTNSGGAVLNNFQLGDPNGYFTVYYTGTDNGIQLNFIVGTDWNNNKWVEVPIKDQYTTADRVHVAKFTYGDIVNVIRSVTGDTDLSRVLQVLVGDNGVEDVYINSVTWTYTPWGEESTREYASITLPARDKDGNLMPNPWTYTFSDLHLLDEYGVGYTYYLEEENGTMYNVSYGGVGKDNPVTEGSVTITNTATSLDVEKQWLDSDGNLEAGDHDPIKVKVYRWVEGTQDEVPYAVVDLSSDNGWKHTFTGLPIRDEYGNPVTYTVEEVMPEGFKYDVTYSENQNTDGTYSFLITNKHHEDKTSIEVEKQWIDAGGNMSTDIEVQLKRYTLSSGSSEEGGAGEGDGGDEGGGTEGGESDQTANVTIRTYQWNVGGDPLYSTLGTSTVGGTVMVTVRYTNHSGPPNAKVQLVGREYDVPYTETGEYTYTFTVDSVVDGMIICIGMNDWGNSGSWTATGFTEMSAASTYALTRDADAGTNKVYDEAFSRKVTLSASNGYKYTFPDLEKYDESGNLYYYEVVELTQLNNFTTSYEGNGTNSGTITIKNTANKESGVELPETGGAGTTSYTMAGFALLSCGAYLLYIDQKRKKGVRKRTP